MAQKPTYEELEKRGKKLEEKEQMLQALLNAPPESAKLMDILRILAEVEE